MNQPSFIKKATKRFSTWQPLLILSLLYIVIYTMVLLKAGPKLTENLFVTIIVHLGLSIAVALIVLWKKNKLNSVFNLPLFLMTIVPSYFYLWFYLEMHIQGTAVFAPYNIFRIMFFVLVFIVPSSYWINFCLMCGFALEAGIAWFYFDLPSLKHIAIGGEPLGLMVSLTVSLTILFFKRRDEQIIRALITQEARSEIVTQLARTFLSIRDRSNTPLQTLVFAVELLKKKYPEENELITILGNSVERLKATGKILNSLESQISWQGRELMTDDEILQWLSDFKEKGV